MASVTIYIAYIVSALIFGRIILSLMEKLLSTDDWPYDYIRIILIICWES